MAEPGTGVSGAPPAAGFVEGTLSEAQLEAWAGKVGRAAVAGQLFVGLYGPLGAGKSTLVRAACRALGVQGPIPSPTFTLLHTYRTDDGQTIRHLDLYRIETEAELLDLGWDELLGAEGAVFVEWAERATGHLPRNRWDIALDFGRDPQVRSVRATPVGAVPGPPQLPEPC